MKLSCGGWSHAAYFLHTQTVTSAMSKKAREGTSIFSSVILSTLVFICCIAYGLLLSIRVLPVSVAPFFFFTNQLQRPWGGFDMLSWVFVLV